MAPDAFDLKRFAPPTFVDVTLRSGSSYRLPGDPDVDDVAIMLRLEQEIQETDSEKLATSLIESKATLKRLILDADPSQDVTDFKIGAEEMVVVFALLVHGQTVAEAVAAAITSHNQGGGEDLAETSEERAERLAEEGEHPGPLSLSKSSSFERSSGSADEEVSLLATG